MNRCVLAIAALAVSILFPLQVQSNLLTNGDFESGNVGFGTTYAYITGDPHEPAEYTLLLNPRDVRTDIASYFDHTRADGTGLMFMGNGGLQPDEVVWFESINVSQGANYRFSLWLSAWYPEPPANFSVRINGINIGPSLTVTTTTGLWDQFSIDWNATSATQALIELVNLSTEYTGNDFALDDLSFVALDGGSSNVPEPSSLALLSLGLAGLAFARRRKQQSIS